jgi:hypothetical protein
MVGLHLFFQAGLSIPILIYTPIDNTFSENVGNFILPAAKKSDEISRGIFIPDSLVAALPGRDIEHGWATGILQGLVACDALCKALSQGGGIPVGQEDAPMVILVGVSIGHCPVFHGFFEFYSSVGDSLLNRRPFLKRTILQHFMSMAGTPILAH